MVKYSIPEDVQHWIQKHLHAKSASFERSSDLAKAILEVSDHFQSASSQTPWQQDSHWAAYLSYFFPLNYIRCSKVIDEAKFFGLFDGITSMVDFGCGPGTFTRALLAQGKFDLEKIQKIDIQKNLAPLFLNQPNHEIDLSFSLSLNKTKPSKNLLVASYVLNEMEDVPEFINDFERIIIIEPSTKQAFPKLLQTRDFLMEQGYQILAPCPHMQACPLAESKKDWCHDRALWEQPDWFKKIEEKLPIKNRTLSFSYLIASKTPLTKPKYKRIVGDPLIEKGKTRWMLCQSQDREFLSHLKRQGKPPELNRGDRIQLDQYEKKGQELRFNVDDLSSI